MAVFDTGKRPAESRRVVGNWKRATPAPRPERSLPASHNVDKMIVGSGIDLVEIHRIQHSVDRYGARFLNKVYTAADRPIVCASATQQKALQRDLPPRKRAPRRWERE